jgi:uncharacterized protein YndB with AHSA1/START domain
MIDLPFAFERTLTIRAQRTTVFRYFTDSERFARWWGKGSQIDPREGGRVFICYPDGSSASGEILEIRAPERIVFTFGYDDPQKPIGPGGSRVVITLAERDTGTELSLRHEVSSEALRDMHVMGWRYHLAAFSHVVTQEQHQHVTALIDRWFELWAETDAAKRSQILTEIASPTISFRDPWGHVEGRAELADHVGAVQLHMPATVKRTGSVRHAQATAVVEWAAEAGGKQVMQGTNVYELAPDGTIASVTGIPK